MNNYKLTISYDGTNFNGWQQQKNTENTIQEIVTDSIQKCIGEKVEVIASGRTDKGVHAYGQVVNFQCVKQLKIKMFLNEINEILPNAIVVRDMEQVPERFHARYNAKQKTYVYKIVNKKINNPFKRKYTLHVKENLNIELMKDAARSLMGTHDFAGFSSTKKSKKGTVKTISNIEIKEQYDELHIYFTGDGFLYNQVRIMVGTLLDIGTGKLKVNSVKDVLQNKDREQAGTTVPPHGLYLVSVEYDKESDEN